MGPLLGVGEYYLKDEIKECLGFLLWLVKEAVFKAIAAPYNLYVGFANEGYDGMRTTTSKLLVPTLVVLGSVLVWVFEPQFRFDFLIMAAFLLAVTLVEHKWHKPPK